MATFASEQEVYDLLGKFFEVSATDPELGPTIQASGLVIQFSYSDPDSVITIDAATPESSARFFEVVYGLTDRKPDVLMTMKADVAHRFWLGRVNLLTAITRRQIVAKGPIPKILKLLPAIQPAYQKYAEYLHEIGRPDLVS